MRSPRRGSVYTAGSEEDGGALTAKVWKDGTERLRLFGEPRTSQAKAIAARRLSHSDYLELMRKRSVIEVTAALQSHPYFKDSLKGLSQTNLHRAQIEEALSKDVYYKSNR